MFNRYPYGLIKKHIKTKSLDDIRMILSRLERRGAGMVDIDWAPVFTLKDKDRSLPLDTVIPSDTVI